MGYRAAEGACGGASGIARATSRIRPWPRAPGVIAETGRVAERLRVREIDDDEGRRLVRVIRRGSGSVVTWRRAQMALP